MDLDDKVAVITGAAGGIGLGMARACLDRGMRVVIADLDAARVAETAEQLRSAGASIAAHACDVRDSAQVETLRDTALSRMGRVDLVCNNAGVGLARPVAEPDDEVEDQDHARDNAEVDVDSQKAGEHDSHTAHLARDIRERHEDCAEHRDQPRHPGVPGMDLEDPETLEQRIADRTGAAASSRCCWDASPGSRCLISW